MVAAIALFGYSIWQHQVESLESDALQVNLAGQQRMLVERAGSLSRALAGVTSATHSERLRARLADTMDQLERLQNRLLTEFGELSPAMHEIYFEGQDAVQVRLDEFVEHVRYLLANENDLAPIQSRVPAMVAQLERLAVGYQLENEQDIHRALLIDRGVRIATVLLLLATGLFVFLPRVADLVGNFAGVAFPFVVMFGALFFVVFAILHRMTIEMHNAQKCNRLLVQELSLLREELERTKAAP